MNCTDCEYHYKEPEQPPCCFCEGMSKFEPAKRHTLSSVKEWRAVVSFKEGSRVDWLIAEVERLTSALEEIAQILPMGTTVRERECWEVIQKTLVSSGKA